MNINGFLFSLGNVVMELDEDEFLPRFYLEEEESDAENDVDSPAEERHSEGPSGESHSEGPTEERHSGEPSEMRRHEEATEDRRSEVSTDNEETPEAGQRVRKPGRTPKKRNYMPRIKARRRIRQKK